MHGYIALGVAAGLAVVGAVHAETFSGSATGSWSNPSAAGSTYTITNNDNVAGSNGLASFDFGTASQAGNTSNLLTFDGVGTVGNSAPFVSAGNSPFVLGNFSYRNGTTDLTSYPGGTSSVALGILLALAQPAGLPDSLFNYSISIDITANTTGNPVQDADTATIVAGTTSKTFTAGGETYTLALLGFSQDNGATFTSSFTAPEQTVSSAKLYGTITTNVATNVPEPGTLVLAGTGLFALAFGCWARRRSLA